MSQVSQDVFGVELFAAVCLFCLQFHKSGHYEND